MSNRDDIKNNVLTENTAQAVLNHLRELESNRSHMQTRWIWELLQNARDASPDTENHVVATVALENEELNFQHNGRGFSMDEVAHLIYHGTTKLEDENAIGQYGSGFLTTHLLSPEIDISGHLHDGKPFSFRLKREIGSVEKLMTSMDRAWERFCDSTEDATERSSSSSPATSFCYRLRADASDAVAAGLATLRRCAPFVVVFNHQFRCITIECAEEPASYEVVNRCDLEQVGLTTVTVIETAQDIQKQRDYLLAEGEGVSVAIPLEPSIDGQVCAPLGNLPRLFLGFPLVGSETFSFPAVINSFDFTPTDNRDGVYLGQNEDEANLTNQAVIEEACNLLLKLIAYATNARWSNTYTLAHIPPITEQSWLKREWLADCLNQFLCQIRQTVAILTTQGPIPPNASILPFAGDAESVGALWDLLSEINEFRERLPDRKEAAGWCEAIESWAKVLTCEPTSFEEARNGTSLASHIEEITRVSPTNCGTLERLERKLQKDVDPVTWLDALYSFLKGDGLASAIGDSRIILDQAGFLDKLDNLYRDNDIDNELKEIGDDILNLRIREKLRDTRLTSLADKIGKGEWSNMEVVQHIVNKLQELSTKGDIEGAFTQASPRLLAWLIANQEWTHLSNFPAFSRKTGDGTCELLRLVQLGGDQTEVALAPIRAWVVSLQPYADLFPMQYIMADDFYAVMPDAAIWQMLTREGYVRTDVVFTGNKTLSEFLPDEPLPEPEGEHRTVDDAAVTDVAFLTKDRVGVMARVRDSQTRARLFWRFLTEWLVTRDPEGLVPGIANCECGESHRYFQAFWLIPIVRNNWVPQGNDIRDRATAHSLAKLLRESDWTLDSLSDHSTTVELLKAIGVTRFDLMRHLVVGDDESRSALDDTMTNILVSTGGDLSHVSDFVEDIKTDKDLPQDLADRRERRRVVHENQRLGGLVEDLVKEGLENEGFTVRRTGIGSDFEIEYDLIEENEEIGIELSRNGRTWLVEVKATREQRVRMTARQAETAVNGGDGFLLCVVPVGESGTEPEKDDVRAKMRFVQNIGPRVDPLCGELNALNELRDDAITPRGSDIQLEIDAGTARIRVDNAVWHNGLCLGDLSAQLK